MWCGVWCDENNSGCGSCWNWNCWRCSCDDNSDGGCSDPTGLPAHIVIGYWEGWKENGYPAMRLSGVGQKWDVVVVSFIRAIPGSVGELDVRFNDIYGAGESASKEQFKNDVKTLQSRGQKVLASLGGSSGNIFQLDTPAQAETFANSLVNIINEYGFDGLDIDVEGSVFVVDDETSIATPTKPINVNMISILRSIKGTFGNKFILSVTPEHPYVQGGAVYWGSSSTPNSGHWGGYLALINNIRDILTYTAIQYYNNWTCSYSQIGLTFPCEAPGVERGQYYNADTLVELSKLIISGFDVAGGHGRFQGLRPDQVVMTVAICDEPSEIPGGDDGYGAQPLSNYESALRRMLEEYPTFRGISAWSIQLQEHQPKCIQSFGYGSDIFASRMHTNVIDPLTRQRSTNGGPIKRNTPLYRHSDSYSRTRSYSGYDARDDGAGLRRNIVIGYWENWVVGGTQVFLRDVSRGWDIVNVSFMLATGSTCTFTPEPSLYGSGSAGKTAFKQDVQTLQARGQKVVISFGGASGYDYSVDTTTDRNNFLSTAQAITEDYGFDGFDVDIEADLLNVTSETSFISPTKPSNINLIYILRQLKQHFGSGFILSMTPEHPYVQGGSVTWGGWHNIFGGYLAALNGVRDILTYVSPQYYNNPIDEYACCTGYNEDSLVGLSKMLIQGFDVPGHGHFNGLRPDQVAFTVKLPGDASSGVLTLAQYKTALQRLLNEYPNFRGVSTWSINAQVREGINNGFVDGMNAVVEASSGGNECSLMTSYWCGSV